VVGEQSRGGGGTGEDGGEWGLLDKVYEFGLKREGGERKKENGWKKGGRSYSREKRVNGMKETDCIRNQRGREQGGTML